MKKTPKRKYNFREMENDLQAMYDRFSTDDNEQTRTQLFLSLKRIAFAVLEVGGYAKFNIDFEKGSYEYALYMFERLVVRSFVPKALDRFPWQHYIRKNIRHVVFNMSNDLAWKEVVRDAEFLLDMEECELNTLEDPQARPPEEQIFKDFFAKHLFKALRLFYSSDEIKRLLPISMDMIYQNNQQLILSTAEPEVQDFCIVLVSVAKRLAKEHNINRSSMEVSIDGMKQALTNSLRSTVFLSSVVNSDFMPKEFLLAMDIDSLYRLSALLGGKKVRIPSLRELDTLLGAVVAVSKVILESKDSNKALRDAKNNFELVFSNCINLQSFMSKVLDSYDLFKDKNESVPIVNLLSVSIKSIDKLLGEIALRAESQDSGELVNQYKELSGSFVNMVTTLTSIGNNASKHQQILEE